MLTTDPIDLNALWRKAVEGTEWTKLDVTRELQHVQQMIQDDEIFPQQHNIFRIFNKLSPSKIKVVLLGQDPYPDVVDVEDEDGDMISIPRACGFSFSSPLGKLPLSLRTIFKEIGVENFGKKSGDLCYLVGSGVFLVNTFLTLKIDEGKGTGKPGSHTSWKCFTHKVLKFLKTENRSIVWLALGDDAKYTMEQASINDNEYIYAPHPASIRFGKRAGGFLGSKVFTKVNDKLRDRKVETIDWDPLDVPLDTKYYIKP